MVFVHVKLRMVLETLSKTGMKAAEKRKATPVYSRVSVMSPIRFRHIQQLRPLLTGQRRT
jgi:hypothetical protein